MTLAHSRVPIEHGANTRRLDQCLFVTNCIAIVQFVVVVAVVIVVVVVVVVVAAKLSITVSGDIALHLSRLVATCSHN